MVDDDNQFLELTQELTEENLEGIAIEGLSKVVRKTLDSQRPKNTIPIISNMFIFDRRTATSFKPAVSEIWCYRKDAFIQI